MRRSVRDGYTRDLNHCHFTCGRGPWETLPGGFPPSLTPPNFQGFTLGHTVTTHTMEFTPLCMVIAYH